MLFEIEPGTGIGPIKFGDTALSIKNMLGSELYYEDWMGGNLENFIFYSGILIGFSGDSTDCPTDSSTVCTIIIRSKLDLSFQGKCISNFSKEQVSTLLKDIGLSFYPISDSVLQCTESRINFYFDKSGLLEQVSLEQKNS